MLNRPPSALRDFLTGEAGGGVLLMTAAAMAMLFANLPGAAGHLYHAFVHARIGPELTPRLGSMTLHLWVNDGLMAIFFLLVGLEIKREMIDGGFRPGNAGDCRSSRRRREWSCLPASISSSLRGGLGFPAAGRFRRQRTSPSP